MLTMHHWHQLYSRTLSTVQCHGIARARVSVCQMLRHESMDDHQYKLTSNTYTVRYMYVLIVMHVNDNVIVIAINYKLITS